MSWRSPQVLVTATIAVIGIVVLSGVIVLTSSSAEAGFKAWIFLQVVLAALCIVAIRARDGASLDIFNPVVLICGTFPLLYSLPAYIVVNRTDTMSALMVPRLANDLGLQQQTLLLASGALVSIVVGYIIAARPPKLASAGTRIRATTVDKEERLRVAVVFALGVILFVCLLAQVGGLQNLLSNLYNRVQFLSGLNYLALGPVLCFSAALANFVSEDRWPCSRRTGFMIAAAVLLTLCTGSKANLAIEALSLLAVVHYRHRRVRPALAGTLLLALMLLLGAYNLYFRNALAQKVSFGSAIEGRGGLWSAFVGDFVENAFFAHQSLAAAITNFPQGERVGVLDTVLGFLASPIPRALYEDKPAASAEKFTLAFSPDLYSTGTSIPPTAVGEMYMAAGPVGVVAGCLLLGAALAWVYSLDRSNPRGLFILAVTVACVLHYMRGELFGAGVAYLSFLLPGLWILSRNPGSRPAAADGEEAGAFPE